MFILALTAVLGRVISIEAASLVFWRVSIAGLAVLIWLILTRPALLRISSKNALAVCSTGFLQGAHWICFFLSVSLANISVALAAFATISLFTSITEPLIERRRIRPREIFCGAIVICGMILIAGGLEEQYHLGLLVGLLGALLHSIFPVLNRKLVASGIYPTTMLVFGMAGAWIAASLSLPFLQPGHLQLPREGDWPSLLVLALLCTALAHTWNIHLLKRLTAYTANLTMNFEPVWGILLGAILFLEYKQLHLAFYLGTALIILANFLDPWLKRRT
ncbi:MAG: hypothetical protein CMP28_10585 [Roseibacillus sp.]|nr:hypothetical protein [Roseibacillus sp.]